MSNIQKWPDDVRLKMIEKSYFYAEPQIYQYGYYDGYILASSEIESLRKEVERLKEELAEFEKMIRDAWRKYS